MSVWEAALLGVVQGLTEFLPISSTAHLLVTRKLLGHPRIDDAFTVVIQLGTLAAVFAYFRADVARLARGLLLDLRRRTVGATPDGRTAWLIVLGTVPAVAVGFTLKKWLKETFFHLYPIAVVSVVFALLMLGSEWWAARRARRGRAPRGESEVGWLDALWVGVWQAFALMPGGSRSGTTITGGLFAGLSRPAAARFSFLLSLPVILGAGLKELYDEYKKLGSPVGGEPPSLFASGDEVAALLVGTAVSAAVGYFAIAFLLRFLQRNTTAVFIAYRLLLGGTIFALLAAGVVN
ncbi:MAG TPA: undecaprenyl-diphosphatase UppP [Gemmata sp.]|nr:undecaprenyl-diphosphatase UppP [Gemmata sp.]